MLIQVQYFGSSHVLLHLVCVHVVWCTCGMVYVWCGVRVVWCASGVCITSVPPELQRLFHP